MNHIHENLSEIRQRMDSAASRSGRKAGAAELIVVSKTFPADQVQAAFDWGQLLFGESRVQEMVEKIPQLPARLRWHLIGHLQKNKIRKVLPLVEMVQSVDSAELAQDMERIAGELGLRRQILLQVNVGLDAAKFGFTPESVRRAMEQILAQPRIELAGLMTIPPLAAEAEKSRPHFAALRELRDQLETEFGAALPVLSMGMSGDYEIAIEEGATLVRVGSAVFGKRG